MVRDVAALFNDDDRIDAYRIESENFESIHNHSAYAMIKPYVLAGCVPDCWLDGRCCLRGVAQMDRAMAAN